MLPTFLSAKKIWFVIFLFITLILVSAWHAMPKKNLQKKTTAVSCNCGSINIAFSPHVPGDALFFGNQTNADCFAWSEFISLNWPSSGNNFGKPGDTSPVQWETYMTREILFPPNGAAPPSWGTQLSSADAGMLKKNRMASPSKLLRRVSKFDSIPINGFDSANTGQAFPNNAPNWLGAQNSTNVWYEVKLNKDIYTFVVQNKYYNAQYQELAVKNDTPIVFPKGVYGGAVGAIELKAAWMEVTDAGNTRWNRYKLSNAVVVDANSGKLRNVTLALVGLHILHKTQKQPTWVWATFEQVDNVPGSPLSTGPYNFYNPHCASQKINVPIPGCLTKDSTSPVTIGCIPNRYPAYYLCKNGPGPVPIQVTRTTPLDATVSDVNKQMQAFIAKNFPQSVWQYYQLVNVIWSTNPTQDPTQPVNVPLTPQSMQPNIPVANTVLETYIQNTTCTSCHTFAAIAPTSDNSKPKQASDFSFAIKFASYPKTAKPRK